MHKAFNTEIVRSITHSAGRFIAIAVISLLGAGFYSGLRMAAPDMRIAGDEFFSGANLYDINVVTTLGLDDTSIALLRDVDGVSQVMPAYRGEALVPLDDGSHAALIESLPLDAARDSSVSHDVIVASGDSAYLNRPILLEGSWPAQADECVVGARAAGKLGIAVGDTVRIDGSESFDDTFAVSHLTVSGLVNSAAYASSSTLGFSSLGSGEVELYLFTSEKAFDTELPYSTAYLTAENARTYQWDSPAYDEAVDSVKENVISEAPAVGEARFRAVVDKAQKELDDARADYERERADVEAELSDAENELANARSQLDSAAAQLVSGRSKVDAAANQISDSEKQLRAREAEYASGKAQLDEQKAAFMKQAANLGEMKNQRSQLASGIEQSKSGLSMLEDRLKQAQKSGDKKLEAGLREQIEALKAEISNMQSQLQQLNEGIAAIEAAEAQLAAAEAQLASARSQLDSGWAQLEQGRKKYLSGMKEYQSGLAEYLEGESSYASGLSDFEEGRAKAEEGFAEAEAKLADAQAEIDDIEPPEVYVIDRKKNVGAASLSSDADGIAQIATFLPFMFFLVAALVSLTSMTRMVDEERMAIGTHKALGYSKGRIVSKYLIYGVLASGIGAVVGTVALGKLLPWFILTAYQVSYAIPVVPLPIDPLIAAKAIGLSVGVTAVSTGAAVYASLREKPASLMLPRAPKPGKRIFLEHIKPLWNRFSFSHKVTARNLLRYKRRFFMAVVGIAGCTALLVIGFGLRDAIGNIVSSQYEDLMGYDAEIRLVNDASETDRARLMAALIENGVGKSTAVDDFNLIAQGPDGDMRIEVVVPQDVDELANFVTLRNRVDATPLVPQGESVVITEKAAYTLGLSVGDEVVLYDENDVGDPTGQPRTFTVGGIAENYLGHYAYLAPEGYRSEFGEDPEYDMLFAMVPSNVDPLALSNNLLVQKEVSTVSFVESRVSTYEAMLDIMNKLIYVIMALSAALAFVVLYNLTNINIDERVREIATLKVLGFTRGEVNAYVFREIAIMVVIGALIGCVLGAPLTLYIARAAETTNMMFGRSIEPLSFVLAFAITLVFAALVALTMRPKLASVNMVESLKSIE